MNGDGPGVEYAAGGRGDEAMRSLARWCGVPLREVMEARGDAGRLGQVMVESRGSFRCRQCGGALGWRGETCRCGRAKPGDADRADPMPWEKQTLDGATAQRMLERRYVIPL